jgi:hypothetical protein
VLLSYKQRLFVLHLDTGVASPILDGNDQTVLVEAKRGRVLFLRRSVPQTEFGSTLETNAAGATMIKEYYRPRDFVYAWNVEAADKPELLTGSPIEKVLQVDEHVIWAITADGDRTLCKIPKHGGGVDVVLAVDNHLVASETYCEFSPGGDYLALTYLHDQHDFHEERELIVVHLVEKRIIHAIEKATSLFPTYGRAPFLNMNWLDESHLYYGYARPGVVDIRSGKQLGEVEISKIRRPSLNPLKRNSIGFFDHEHGLLYYRDDPTPVVNVLDPNNRNAKIRELEICPQGRWAAFVSPDDNNAYIIDGRTRQKEMLVRGMCFSLAWLPSAKVVEEDPTPTEGEK